MNRTTFEISWIPRTAGLQSVLSITLPMPFKYEAIVADDRTEWLANQLS